MTGRMTKHKSRTRRRVAARIASEADARGIEPARLIEDILEREIAAREKGDGRG